MIDSSYSVHLVVHFSYGPFLFEHQWVTKNMDDGFKVVSSSYCDICGPMTTRSVDGAKYFLTFSNEVPFHGPP
jgi:hypothetical protein